MKTVALSMRAVDGLRSVGLASALIGMVVGIGALPATAASMCGLSYTLPGDVDVELPAEDAQTYFDAFSWDTFLAINSPGVGERPNTMGDNQTQWSKWSSTDDLIQCQSDSEDCVCPDGDCSQSGARYYPPACQIEGHENYRVLGEVAKVDDLFLEAANRSLSNDPVLTFRGTFLRYEIVLNPVSHDFVIENEYYSEPVLKELTEPVVFPCGELDYEGGDPADPRIGAIVLKNAWMELGRLWQKSQFHTEDLLVYTPADRSSTGLDSCELKTMALVGQHLIRKTESQPKWIWATFEHFNNVPDCTSLPPAGDMEGATPSLACPTSVSRNYNFYPEDCSEDDDDPAACQSCNVVPVSNAPGCVNESLEGDVSWCLDLPPAETAGLSKLCRQVPVKKYYPSAHAQNWMCAQSLGRRSVWGAYELISTQWFNAASSGVCETGSGPTDRTLIRPQVPVEGDDQSTRPFLGNTSMESYSRPNCMGCHTNASVDGTKDTPGTDLAYWLQLEVSAAGAGIAGH